MSEISYIDEIDITNKKVLLRVDFNVSLTADGRINDDTRIHQALPTVNYLLGKNNSLIIVSHLDSPRGRDPKLSLKPVADRLQLLLPDYKIELVENFLTNGVKTSEDENGKVILLENIRYYPEEKENNPEFAKKLASLANVFVNDAFGVCHRNDASIVGISQYLPSYGGLLLKKEIQTISSVINNPKRPFVVILGGAKISTKINLVEKLLEMVDYLLIGGAMANNFLKAQGLEVGKSLIEDEYIKKTKEIITKAEKTKAEKKLFIPEDVIIKSTSGVLKSAGTLSSEDFILDLGELTIKKYKEKIQQAHTIIWNGPMGYFEEPKYRKGTDEIYQAIIENKDVISIVGGGETVTAISGKADNNKITHISTGGGAMLEFIEKGILPGIETLKR